MDDDHREFCGLDFPRQVLNLFYADGTPAQDQMAQILTTSALPVPTPEPGTLGLVAIGALLAARKRRQVRSQLSRS
jgi:hypothetical protein